MLGDGTLGGGGLSDPQPAPLSKGNLWCRNSTERCFRQLGRGGRSIQLSTRPPPPPPPAGSIFTGGEMCSDLQKKDTGFCRISPDYGLKYTQGNKNRGFLHGPWGCGWRPAWDAAGVRVPSCPRGGGGLNDSQPAPPLSRGNLWCRGSRYGCIHELEGLW